jgi:hypothetical protein
MYRHNLGKKHEMFQRYTQTEPRVYIQEVGVFRLRRCEHACESEQA